MNKLLPEKQTSRKASIYRGVSCLNCEHPLDLSDVYCPYCGQLNSTKKLSFSDFFKEFFVSIFNYDSRIRHTIKDLLFKPGTITKNYVEGKRLKYANPFRFFLSASIIYFLLQNLIGLLNSGNNSFVNINNGDQEEAIEEIVNEQVMNNIPNSPTMKLNKDTLFIEKDTILLKQPKKEKPTYITQKELDTLPFVEGIAERINTYRDFYTASEIKNPKIALDSLNHTNTKYTRWLYSKNKSFDKIKEDPFSFVNYLLNKVPFFLFFFAPFFALFFWLIYSKKKYTYMEHLVFIFHIFSFVFLAMLISLLPDLLIGDDILFGILILLIGPFYFYKALRNFYQQSRIITLIKFVALNIVFSLSASIIAVLFFLITAAAY